MKGQVSTELLVIVALVLLLFIPLLVLVYFKANEANQQIGTYQAELAVSRMASLANSVGSLGTNTSVVTDIYIPPNTLSFSIKESGSAGGEAVLQISTPQGKSEVVDLIRYPLSNPGDIPVTPGTWMRVNISSEYSNADQAHIKIEKV